jgi:DNA-binding NtrC family response regulator
LRWARARDLGLEAIVVTGQPSLQSALEALELGAADYLLKPIEPVDHLRGRVRQALARQRRRLLLRALDSTARVWAERALAMGADEPLAAPLCAALERLAQRPEGPARLLVVCDAEAAEQVAHAGHLSESPVDVAGAQAALLGGPFDALLVGAGAPAAQAFELTAQARALPWPVPVIWGAPTVHFDDAVRAIRAGATALVQRPIEARAFGQTLARLVRHSREETRALALERVLDALDVV